MARDRARLRRKLAQDFARQAQRGAPDPEQVLASRVESLQARISQLHTQIVPGELTMAQRSVAGKIPEPKAVEALPGGVLGLANFPSDKRGSKTINRILDWVTRQERRRTRIALDAADYEGSTVGKGVEAVLRHETGHHLLGARGIGVAEHEPILAQTGVPGTTTGVNFRLLQTAAAAHQTPTNERIRRALSRERLKLGLIARRRQNR